MEDARYSVGRVTKYVTQKITTVDVTGMVATAAGKLWRNTLIQWFCVNYFDLKNGSAW